MNTKDFITICFGLDSDCTNIRVKWIGTPGLLTACIDDNCIDIAPNTLVDGPKCVEGWVHCDDCKFGNSKPIYFKKCWCDTSADCEDCQDCTDNICTDNLTSEQESQGRLCNGDCPPDKPFFNATVEKCAECVENSIHPTDKCIVCKDGEWAPKDCGTGSCEDGTCVECTLSSDCANNTDGRTRCVDNGCDCEEGFYYDYVQRKCVVIPPCDGINDCPECFDCIKTTLADGSTVNSCEPIVCPDGFICIVGKGCVEKCDCDTLEGCSDDKAACVKDVPSNQCYCNTCPATTEAECDCEGFYWNVQTMTCDPNPCYKQSCGDGSDCGPECGCNQDTNQCEPCNSKICTTCGTLLGCECVDGVNCNKGDDCAQFNCPTCGDRPDCKCKDDGTGCEEVPCDSKATLEKSILNNGVDAQLDYSLTSTVCCECPKITLDSRFITYRSGNLVGEFDVRKGSISNRISIPTIPLVSDSSNDLILENEEATQGQIKVLVDYTFDRLISAIGEPEVYESVTEADNLLSTIDVAGVGQRGFLFPLTLPGQPFSDGILTSATLRFILDTELVFENGCNYDPNQLISSYTFNSDATNTINNINSVMGGLGNPDYWAFKVLDTTDCKSPEVKYYRAPALEDGSIGEWETTAFRKAYLTEDTTGTNRYKDYITLVEDNAPIVDNHGMHRSGYYYKALSDCVCEDDQVVYYESSCQKPGRLVYCDPTIAYIEFFNCGQGLRFTQDFRVTLQENQLITKYGVDDPDGQLKFGVYINGSTTPYTGTFKAAGADNIVYASGTEILPGFNIDRVDIKFSHDNCEECTLTIYNEDTILPEKPDVLVTCISDTQKEVTVTNNLGQAVLVSFNGQTPVSVSGGRSYPFIYNGTDAETPIEYTYPGGCVIMDTVDLSVNCCEGLEISIEQTVLCEDADNFEFEAMHNGNINSVVSWYYYTGLIASRDIDDPTTTVFDESNFLGSGTTLSIPTGTLTYNTVQAVLTVNGCTVNSNIVTIEQIAPRTIGFTETTEIVECGTTDITLNVESDPAHNGTVSYTRTTTASMVHTTPVTAGRAEIPLGLVPQDDTVTLTDVTATDACRPVISSDANTRVITIFGSPSITSATLSSNTICNGDSSTINVTGTANSTVTLDNGSTILIDSSNTGSLIVTPTTTTVYTITDITSTNTECDTVTIIPISLTLTVVGGNSVGPGTNYVCSDDLTSYSVSFVSDGTPTVNTGTLTNNVGDNYTVSGVTPNTSVTVTVGTGTCQITRTLDPFVCDCPTIPAPSVNGHTKYMCGLGDTIPTTTLNNSFPYVSTWYSDATLLNEVATGLNYTPPTITGDTTFYIVNVDPTTGCVSNHQEVTYDVVDGIVVEITGLDTVCNDGSIPITLGTTVTEGSGTYTYVWSDNSTNPSLQTTSAGTFTVVVTDSITGCMETVSKTITTVNCNPCNGVTIDVTSTVTNESCSTANSNDGVITLNITGGTPPYTVTGELGAITTPMLAAGTYEGDVTDSNGCVGDYTVTVVSDNNCPDCTDLESSFNSSQGQSTGLVGPFVVAGGISWTFQPFGVTDRLVIYQDGVAVLDTGGATVYETAQCVGPGATINPVECGCATLFWADHTIGDVVPVLTGTVNILPGGIFGGTIPLNGNITYEVIGSVCGTANTAWNGNITCIQP